jgi:hypothetical protein
MDAEPEPDFYSLNRGNLVNAAFLLVTSAMLVGQAATDKAPPKAPPTAAPVAPAVTSGCGQSCGQDPCGCEGFGHRLRDKLRGLFSRNSCDTCQTASCGSCGSHVHTPFFKSSCDECARPKFFASHACNSCAPATCDSCDRGGFLAKLRERFHRNDSCCDGGCSSGCSGSPVPVVTPKTGEKIETGPKKLPTDTPKEKIKDKKPADEVRIETQSAPFAPNAIQVTPTVPNVEVVPVPTPRVTDGARRDPF